MTAEYAFHPLANMFPLLEGGEFAALVEDVQAHGLHEPVVLFEDMILDGRNRYRACTAAGIEPRYREKSFGSHAEAARYVISANIHRRHLTAEQRRELVVKLLETDPEQSDRRIAQTAKTDHKTVGGVRKKLEARGEIPHVEMRTDSKGRSQPAHKAAPETDRTGITATDTEQSAEDAGSGNDHGGAGHAPNRRQKPRARKSRFDAEHYAFILRAHVSGLAALLDEYPDRFAAVLDHLLGDADVVTELARLAQHPKVQAAITGGPVLADLDLQTFNGGSLLRSAS
jgi:ParB-like chromosome segregation protein Spo0J